MRLTTLAAAFAAMFLFAQSAQAHTHAHHVVHHQARVHVLAYRHQQHRPREAYAYAETGRYTDTAHNDGAVSRPTTGYVSSGEYRGRSGGRPAAWCGWEMRRLVGRDPGPSYNLARNWAHWGQGGAPGIGAVVVWPHHVGKIVGRENGQWVIESGNDGHALRTRPRSIGGAIAFRWG